MIEADRSLGVLPELQKQCLEGVSGIVLGVRTDPEIVSRLPKSLRDCIANGGAVIVDLAGNFFPQPNTNGKK